MRKKAIMRNIRTAFSLNKQARCTFLLYGHVTFIRQVNACEKNEQIFITRMSASGAIDDRSLFIPSVDIILISPK